MRQARGVLPHKQDKVMKDPRAEAVLVFVSLRPDLDADGAANWLDKVAAAIEAVRALNADGDRVATVATGLSPSFFLSGGVPRFADLELPAAFASLPPVPDAAPVTADVVFYVMATYEAVAAEFVAALWATRPDVATIAIERGYQRRDESEPFGYRDGVRNVRRDERDRVVFIDREAQPEEPTWAERGTYMAYMKIRQDTDVFAALPAEEQDAVIGRDRSGRRLDLPAGTNPHEEGAMADALPSLSSHVRKAGPRTDDSVGIFRRGVPYLETSPDGAIRQGLQFVSFQASIDHFTTVFNRWMLNQNFPPPRTGRRDELFERQLVAVEKIGFFFVPGDDDEPLSARLRPAAKRPPKPKKGRVHVRKGLVDANGAVVMGDLAGFTFRVLDADGNIVGGQFTTNAAGHGHSDELPAGVPLRLEEIAAPVGLQLVPPSEFVLDEPNVVLHVTNTVPSGAVYGR